MINEANLLLISIAIACTGCFSTKDNQPPECIEARGVPLYIDQTLGAPIEINVTGDCQAPLISKDQEGGTCHRIQVYATSTGKCEIHLKFKNGQETKSYISYAPGPCCSYCPDKTHVFIHSDFPTGG